MTADNYNQPYPRPFPCGSLVLGFNRGTVHVLGHHMDIADGVCSVRLEIEGEPATLLCFVEPVTDRVWLRLLDGASQPRPAPWDRVRLLPDPDGLTADGTSADEDTYAWIPGDRSADRIAGDGDMTEQQIGYGLYALGAPPEGALSFRQVLPFRMDGAAHLKDRAFRLSLHVDGELERASRTNWHGVVEQMPLLERRWLRTAPFLATVTLDHGLAATLPDVVAATPTVADHATADAARDAHWADYWARSGVALADQTFERIWYHNLYFLNCAVREGVTCPGLFANWSYRKVGTAWHGDYHLNYNTQQPFWVTFLCEKPYRERNNERPFGLHLLIRLVSSMSWHRSTSRASFIFEIVGEIAVRRHAACSLRLRKIHSRHPARAHQQGWPRTRPLPT